VVGRLSRIAYARAGFLVVAFAMSSCTSVTESTLIGLPSANGVSQLSCYSTLGSYYLPKSYISFQIDAVTYDTRRPDYALHDLATVVLPHELQGICLDYLASSFADDSISVKKTNADTTTSQQLLQSVSSSAVDQTAIIIRTLIRAAFTLMSTSGFRAGGTAPTVTSTERVADLSFDPFDQHQTAVVNDTTRHFGFCFVLESFTFGRPDRHRNAQTYCKDPLSFVRTPSEFAKRYADFDTAVIQPRAFGIMYKPRASYELSIYAKDDPDGPGPWLLRRTQRMDLENISPVISINIDRAVFTEKQISLVFTQGDLNQICIYKKSELAQVVQIPLEVVRSIVALPTQVLQVQYDQITQTNALVTAQNNILASQNKLIGLLTSPATAANPGAPAGPPAFPSSSASSVPGTPASQANLAALTRTDATNSFQGCAAINSNAPPTNPAPTNASTAPATTASKTN
jgi:hypothetical protein